MDNPRYAALYLAERLRVPSPLNAKLCRALGCLLPESSGIHKSSELMYDWRHFGAVVSSPQSLVACNSVA